MKEHGVLIVVLAAILLTGGLLHAFAQGDAVKGAVQSKSPASAKHHGDKNVRIRQDVDKARHMKVDEAPLFSGTASGQVTN